MKSGPAFKKKCIVVMFILILLLPLGCTVYKTKKAVQGMDVTMVSEDEKLPSIATLEQANELFQARKKTTLQVMTLEKLALLYEEERPVKALECYTKASQLLSLNNEFSSAYELSKRAFERLGSAPELSPTAKLTLLQTLRDLSYRLELFEEESQWLVMLFELSNKEEYLTLLKERTERRGAYVDQLRLRLVEVKRLFRKGDYLQSYLDMLTIRNDGYLKQDAVMSHRVQMQLFPLIGIFEPGALYPIFDEVITFIVANGRIDDLYTCQAWLINRSSLLEDRTSDLLALLIDDSVLSLMSPDQRVGYLWKFQDLPDSLTELKKRTGEKCIEQFEPGLTPKSKILIATAALSLGETERLEEIVAPFLEDRAIGQKSSDYLDALLIKAELLIRQDKPLEAIDYLSSPLADFPDDQFDDKLIYVSRAAAILYGANKFRDSLDLLLKLYPIPESRVSDPLLLSDYLMLMANNYDKLQDFFSALSLAQNAYSLISKEKGMEYRKTELYEYIARISLKSGFIDYKFNPFDLAQSFSKNIEIPSFYPSLLYYKAHSIEQKKNRTIESVISLYSQWLNDATSCLLLFPEDIEEKLARAMSFCLEHSQYKEAFFLLDLYERRKEVNIFLKSSSEPSSPEDNTEIFTSGTDDDGTAQNPLKQYVLLERARNVLLLDIRKEAMKRSKNRELFMEKIETWKRYDEEHKTMEVQLVLNDRNLQFHRDNQRMFRYLSERFPAHTVIFGLSCLADKKYTWLISKNELTVSDFRLIDESPMQKGAPVSKFYEFVQNQLKKYSGETIAFISREDSRCSGVRKLLLRIFTSDLGKPVKEFLTIDNLLEEERQKQK